MNLQLKMSRWLLTHLHYFHKTTCMLSLATELAGDNTSETQKVVSTYK